MIEQLLYILALSYFQSVSFSVISRARNRNNYRYHLMASIFSNSIWFLTFRALVLANMTWVLFLPYTLGTVLGSLTGAKVSMVIERWLHAASDDHLRRAKAFIAVSRRPLTGEIGQADGLTLIGPFADESEARRCFAETYDPDHYFGVMMDGIDFKVSSKTATP